MKSPQAQQSPPPPVPGTRLDSSWPPQGASVVLDGVSKSFGGLVAVSDIRLALEPGVTAILGPNGAGKSTLLRMICGLCRPTTGSVWVAGGDPRFDAEARGRIGLVPQQDGVFERLTAFETVLLAARLSKLADPESAARRVLGIVELDPSMERPVGTFSKGMRQRVKVAQALVHDPSVVVLDEPLNGLDPRQRRHMIELFRRLGEGGCTVLVSSHVLEEVERFGSRVAVIAKGRLVAEGDFREIRTLLNQQPHRIRIRCDQVRPVASALMALENIASCSVDATGDIEVTTDDVVSFRRELPRLCKEANIRLEAVKPLDDDLESVFRYLIGQP